MENIYEQMIQKISGTSFDSIASINLLLTVPSFSEALAFHSRIPISSDPDSRYLLSRDHITVCTRCIRFVWYTSLMGRREKGN